MEQLRRVLATIQVHLGGLRPSHKLLLASLAVIMLMSLFLVSQYAGRRQMVELLPGSPRPEQDRAAAFLRTSGYTYKTSGDGRTLVAVDDQRAILAEMGQAGQLPSNTSLIFENILKTQSWMNPRETNRQLYMVMLQNELGGVIAKFRGVKSASVFLDVPERVGFGGAARLPKASVTLFLDQGAALSQATVDAIARMVAGSIAGLDLDKVSISDATNGVQRKVSGDAELSSSAYREAAAAMERQFRDKIMNLVSYIEGVAVEVTANVDVTRVKAQVQRNLPMGEGTLSLPRRAVESSTTQQETGGGAEPGVRSNAAADINAGGPGRGTRNEQQESEEEFDNRVGTRVESIEDPRGMPKMLVATVNVPRGYVVGLLARAGEEGEPAEDEVRQRFEAVRKTIEESLAPHLQAVTPEGEVVPGQVVVALVSHSGGGRGGNGAGAPGWAEPISAPGILALGGGVVDKVVLGALACVAMGMMVLMVRKSGRRAVAASAEELAGVPPALEAKSDLVGEADETETAMAGIVVGEEEIKAQKLREQVSELIRESPDTAVKLLNRWISVER